MDRDLIDLMLVKIAESKSSIELFLASGGAKSWEAYCRMTGEYAALEKMESDAKDLRDRFVES